MKTMKNIWKSTKADVAAIILLTVVAYIPAMRGGFVFDDDPLIVHNPLLHVLHAGDALHRFWFTTQATDYYPLTWSLLWEEWRLWGNNAVGYHVVNVLLHAINAVLVWRILRRLKIPGAWLAGLVFAVHPVNAATAAWISEQKNTLSMLFFAVATLLYLWFDETSDWRWYGVSLMAFLLALFSKIAVVMLPVVLLGCVWWQRGRIRWKDLLRSLPFFALSLALGLTTIWIQHNRDLAAHAVRAVGFPFRLAAAGWVPWFYFYKALLPFDLSVIYPQWNIDVSWWGSYLPGVLLMGASRAFLVEAHDLGAAPLLFATGYFVVNLFPVLGFLDQGFYQYSLVADHWQYYSIVGPIALVIAAAELICRRWGARGRNWGGGAVIVLLVVLGMATWTRAGIYGSSETLAGYFNKESKCLGSAQQSGGSLGTTGAGTRSSRALRGGGADQALFCGCALQSGECSVYTGPDGGGCHTIPRGVTGQAGLRRGTLQPGGNPGESGSSAGGNPTLRASAEASARPHYGSERAGATTWRLIERFKLAVTAR